MNQTRRFDLYTRLAAINLIYKHFCTGLTFLEYVNSHFSHFVVFLLELRSAALLLGDLITNLMFLHLVIPNFVLSFVCKQLTLVVNLQLALTEGGSV